MQERNRHSGALCALHYVLVEGFEQWRGSLQGVCDKGEKYRNKHSEKRREEKREEKRREISFFCVPCYPPTFILSHHWYAPFQAASLGASILLRRGLLWQCGYFFCCHWPWCFWCSFRLWWWSLAEDDLHYIVSWDVELVQAQSVCQGPPWEKPALRCGRHALLTL